MRGFINLIGLCAFLVFSGSTSASYMQSKKDKTLEGNIHAALARLPLTGSSFEVGVHHGEVLLAGTTQSIDLQKAVVSTVSAVPGVVRVHDELKSGPRGDRTYDLTMAKQLDLIVEDSGIAGPQRIAAYVIEGVAYLMGPVTQMEGDKVVKSIVAWSNSHPELKKIIKLFGYWKEVPGLMQAKGCQIYLMNRGLGAREKFSWDGHCVKGIAEGQGVVKIVNGPDSLTGRGAFEHGSLARGTLEFKQGGESLVYTGEIFNLKPQGAGTARIETAELSLEFSGIFDEGKVQSWTTATNLKTGEVRYFGQRNTVNSYTEPDSGKNEETSGIGDIFGGLLQGAGQAMQSMGGKQYGTGVLIEGIGGAVAGDEAVANRAIQSLNSGQTTPYGPGLAATDRKKENCRYSPSGSLRGCVIPNMNQCIRVQSGSDGQAVRVNGCSQTISVFMCSSGQGQRSANAVLPLCSSLVNSSYSNSVSEPLHYYVEPGRGLPISGSSVTWACSSGYTDVLGWDGKTLQTVCYESGLQTDSR
ncbi:MAG: BON domain-containing protein [Pseudomonas putida]|nr:BON domain-containing protein [Pseudomonas putida]